jgi:hypothetical protein
MPYTETPFSQAIFQMFDNLDSWLEENYDNLPNEAVKVYLFGGCAMHLHINNRTSNDLDAELQSIQELKPIKNIEAAIQSVDFDDENEIPCILDFDGNFSPTIAPIHPDYKERATRLHTTKTQLVSLYLVSAVDIAVSKLGRLESVDLQDIKSLYRNDLFTIEEFLETAEEAKSYYAVSPDKLQFNISQARGSLEEEV